jgi:hypothetical protein
MWAAMPMFRVFSSGVCLGTFDPLVPVYQR